MGEPNLVVTPPSKSHCTHHPYPHHHHHHHPLPFHADNVLKTTLSLYMEDTDQAFPMPTFEEVLVCSEQTTEEEVTLLWKRALGDPKHFRLFCLVHAEQLSYQVCDKALWSLSQLSQGKKGRLNVNNLCHVWPHNNVIHFFYCTSTMPVQSPFVFSSHTPDYKIVIICSSEEEEKSHLISKLHFYRRPYPAMLPDTKFAEYLMGHFKRWPMSMGLGRTLAASTVDPDK